MPPSFAVKAFAALTTVLAVTFGVNWAVSGHPSTDVGVSQTKPVMATLDNVPEYDVIICGGGPAGLAAAIDLHLANPNGNFKVAVVGPGYRGDYNPAQPEFWPWMTDSGTFAGVYPIIAGPRTSTLWTTIQPGNNFAAGRSQYFPDVHLRGAQTAVNGGVLGSNSGQYYDYHANLYSDPVGWNFTYLAKRRATHRRYNGPNPNPACHGNGSGKFWYTDYQPEPFSQALIQAGSRLLGLPITDPACTHRSEVVGTAARALEPLDMSAPLSEPWKRWRRGQFDATVFQHFEDNSGGRLKYIEGAWVNELVWNDDRDKVKGILYTVEGKQFKLKAKKEVIVSMGTLGTIKFGLLNGFGPRAELEALGIDVVKDLPSWGKTWQDDFGYQTQWISGVPEARIAPSVTQFGWRTSIAKSRGETVVDVNLLTTQLLSAVEGAPVTAYLFLVKVINADSRGTAKLTSRDERAKMQIEYPVLDIDLERFCEALNMTRALVVNASIPLFEAGATAPIKTCDQFKTAIRTDNTQPIMNDYHHVGDLIRSGLTSRGKVNGITGLRWAGPALVARANDRHSGYQGAVDQGFLTARWFCLEHGCQKFLG